MHRRLVPFCAATLAIAIAALLSRPSSSASAPLSEAGGSSQRPALTSITTITTDTIVIPTYPYAAHLYAATNTTYNIPYRWLNWGEYEGSHPHPVDKSYTRLTLENNWLRVSLLPELGGRVYEMIFKPTGNNELYRNTVIKPTHWGPSEQGWWLAAGGLEWGLPVEEHGYESALPWSYTIITGAAGITVTLRDSTQPDRLRAAITVFLPRDRAVLIVRPRLENDRSIPLDFKWWDNAMLAPGPGNSIGKQGSNPNGTDLKFIFPESQVTVHSTGDPTLPQEGHAMAWPIYQNRDLSRLQTWDQWLGFFARPAASQDWVGVIDQAHQEGIVRVFPRSVARGSKGFAMGWQRPIGAGEWTDDDSYYAELHGGLAPTFWDSASIGAHQAIEWEEAWYPVAGVNDLASATNEAALLVAQAGSLVNAQVFSTRPRIKPHLTLWQRSNCRQVADFEILAIDPTAAPSFSVPTSIPLNDLAILFHDQSTLFAGYQAQDCVPPWAAVTSLPSIMTTNTFTVSWTGGDLYSGLATHDVQFKDLHGGLWTDWLTATATTSASFSGLPGHTYFFRARARDVAGNLGAFRNADEGDASTTVLLAPAPVLEFSYKQAPSFSAAHQPISCLIVLKNTGNLSGAILLTDTLPLSAALIGGTLASSQPPLPAVNGRQLTWSGVISGGASVQITYALTPAAELLPGAQLTNTVEIAGGVLPVTHVTTTTIAINVYLPLVWR